MPKSIVTIRVKYENNVSFSAEAKEGEGAFKTIVKAEEE